jgi:hypothetical protein
MNVLQLEHWILDRYEGIIVIDAYRERSFFYNPDGSMKKGIYFTTIKNVTVQMTRLLIWIEQGFFV